MQKETTKKMKKRGGVDGKAAWAAIRAADAGPLSRGKGVGGQSMGSN